jgi:predicted membrane GTPase involved in stress response
LSKSQTFRQHHVEVHALVARIEQILDAGQVDKDAAPVAAVVRELFGKFGVHLSIEDQTLYPKLRAHADAHVRSTAERFEREMGDLRPRFDTYRHKWPGPLAISRDPQAFCTETREILASLKKRVAREETELYELYDKVG